jgi:chromosome segregation ATPase
MFFGKDEPAKIKVEELRKLLNSSFNGKLGSFEAKVSGIIKGMPKIQTQFTNACEEFELLSAEPDTEGFYGVSINSVKAQKNSYARALKRIISDLKLDTVGAENIYDEYQTILSNIAKTANDILKANSSFKQVVYCYANHLGNFKRSYSDIEGRMSLLKNEIGKRTREFSEYAELNKHVSKLNFLNEELVALNEGMGVISRRFDNASDITIKKSEADIRENLANKRAELSRAAAESLELSNKINALTLSLERASKKFDHLSASKRELHNFVTNPINTIRNEADLNDFVRLLQELRGLVDIGKIDVKNKTEVNAKISELINSDIYQMIKALDATTDKKNEINSEIRMLENVLSDIKDAKSSSDKSLEEVTKMKSDAEEITKKISEEKEIIAKQFLQYYGKRISIV